MAENKPVQTDKDFEEYQKVMQPRTAKGPSWANEPQLRPQAPAKGVKGALVEEEQTDVDPMPLQDALSDLEWMKQRMAETTVEDSHTAAHRPEPQPTNKADGNQVRSRKVSPLCPVSSDLDPAARSLRKRSYEGHHSQNFSALRPQPCLFLYS